MTPWVTVVRVTLQHHRDQADKLAAHHAAVAEHERSLWWWMEREFEHAMRWPALVEYGQGLDPAWRPS